MARAIRRGGWIGSDRPRGKRQLVCGGRILQLAERTRRASRTDEWCYVPNAKGVYAAGMRIAEDFFESTWLSVADGSRVGVRLPGGYDARACFFGDNVGLARAICRVCNGAATAELEFCGDTQTKRLRAVRHAGKRGRMVPGHLSATVRWNARGWEQEWRQAVEERANRVVRGGAAGDAQEAVRSAVRESHQPGHVRTTLGFRVARSYLP